MINVPKAPSDHSSARDCARSRRLLHSSPLDSRGQSLVESRLESVGSSRVESLQRAVSRERHATDCLRQQLDELQERQLRLLESAPAKWADRLNAAVGDRGVASGDVLAPAQSGVSAPSSVEPRPPPPRRRQPSAFPAPWGSMPVGHSLLSIPSPPCHPPGVLSARRCQDHTGLPTFGLPTPRGPYAGDLLTMGEVASSPPPPSVRSRRTEVLLQERHRHRPQTPLTKNPINCRALPAPAGSQRRVEKLPLPPTRRVFIKVRPKGRRAPRPGMFDP
eukprot:Hpha_TRINITY_DN16281_c4_g7::TRINITY_DN16281_c4_g7_i1::g.14886::m.14886